MGTTDESTPKSRRVCGSCMRVQPWLPLVVFRASSTPAPYMPPGLESPSSQLCLCNFYTPAVPGSVVKLCIGDSECVHPRSGRKCNNSGHTYQGPPSIAALAPPPLAAAALSRNGTIQRTTALTRSTYHGSPIRPKSSRCIPQKLPAHDDPHTYYSYRPTRPKGPIKCAEGKQATIGSDRANDSSGRFRASMALEKAYSHTCPDPDPAPVATVVESAPPNRRGR